MHSVRAEERDRGLSRTRCGRVPKTSAVIIGRDGLIERCPARAQRVEKRGQDDSQREVENHGIKRRVPREDIAGDLKRISRCEVHCDGHRFIVKKDPNVTSEDIVKFCGTQLSSYSVPKRIEFRTSLPKTNVGKILRRELRDEMWPV